MNRLNVFVTLSVSSIGVWTHRPRLRSLLSKSSFGTLVPCFPVGLTARKAFSCALLALALAVSSSHALAQALQTEQASPADSFVDSIGVGTHLTYQNTLYYTNWPQVYQALQDLGVRHIRDGYFDPSWGAPYTTMHQQLALAHILTDYVIPYNPAITPQNIAELSAETHDMEILEAPNECDQIGVCGANTTVAQSLSNMVGFLPTVQAAGKQLNIPVLGPSYAAFESYAEVGSVASDITYSNLHVYMEGYYPGNPGWGGPDAEGNAYGCFPFWIDLANIEGPGLPPVISETGYRYFPNQPSPYYTPLNVQASYVPRTLLLAYMHGVGRTYLYELLEEPDSPGFGLIDAGMNKRPDYYAVQNLIANLWDEGPAFNPGSLQFSLQGGGSTLNHLLFQKRDGSFWMILWLEQSSYDRVTMAPTPVTPESVTLTLAGEYFAPNVGNFDDTGNVTWTSVQGSGRQLPLTVTDQLTLVKILPQ